MNPSPESLQKTRYRLEVNGPEVTRRRLALTMNREKLAEKAEISVSRLNKMEAGLAGGVSPDTVNALADALGCEPSDIQIVAEIAS